VWGGARRAAGQHGDRAACEQAAGGERGGLVEDGQAGELAASGVEDAEVAGDREHVAPGEREHGAGGGDRRDGHLVVDGLGEQRVLAGDQRRRGAVAGRWRDAVRAGADRDRRLPRAQSGERVAIDRGGAAREHPERIADAREVDGAVGQREALARRGAERVDQVDRIAVAMRHEPAAPRQRQGALAGDAIVDLPR
jgi:hypothetical protein